MKYWFFVLSIWYSGDVVTRSSVWKRHVFFKQRASIFTVELIQSEYQLNETSGVTVRQRAVAAFSSDRFTAAVNSSLLVDWHYLAASIPLHLHLADAETRTSSRRPRLTRCSRWCQVLWCTANRNMPTGFYGRWVVLTAHGLTDTWIERTYV